MFFDRWHDLIRVIVVGTLAYFALIVLLRLTGKRTLTKMNAFDLVVTVALGSTLASILISRDVSLVEGIAAFALLALLQFALTWSSVRWKKVEQLVKGSPTLLCWRGRMLDDALRAERMTHAEVYAAVRAAGHAGLAEVEAVVLETDGSVSVVSRSERGEAGALEGLNPPGGSRPDG